MIPHDIHRKHILLPPPVINQSLAAEANFAPHLELHPTAGVEGAVASPILGGGSYNVEHHIYQASNNARTIAPQLGSQPVVHGRTTRHSRWPIGGIRRLPGNGPIGGGSCLPGDNRPSCWQCINTSLLGTIHSRRPCCRGPHSTSHNGIADRAPGLERKAVAAPSILVGVGACATLPSKDFGRR
jgi:hypothetical protein